MGSSSLALAYVANGRFDAFIQQGGMSNWDVAAAGLIAERAGATVTDMDGGPWFDIGRKPRAVGVGRRAGGPPRDAARPDALGVARMAEPIGIVGSVDPDGYLRFRHITVDHDELMTESLEEEGVLDECPICIGTRF